MKSPYLTRPAADMLIMGGASILAYLACRALEGGAGAAALGAAWDAVAALVAALNGAHFAATSCRLYRSREAMRQFPLTAALVPAVVLAGVAASFSWPLAVAPYFIKLFLLWSPYHYSGQTVGLSVLYTRRAGLDFEPLERKALSGFVFGTFLTSVARAEMQVNRFDYFGIGYPSFGLPAWVATACVAGMALCGLVFLAFALRRKRRLPAIVYVIAAAQFVWFVLGPKSPLFYPLVPMFHGAQYLLVSWYLNRQERRAEGAASDAVESARWGAWSLAGYVLLFLALPKLLSVATGQSFFFATAVFTGGVQLHHFFVDGVIWRLRTPKLAAAMTAAALAVALIAPSAFASPALRPERIVLRTDAGDLVIGLYAGAPKHAAKWIMLAKQGAWDGAPIAKIDPSRFVAFASARRLGKAARLPVESAPPHRAGVVTMAHEPSDPDTSETAFAILFADIPSMDGRFSAVGEVVGGKDVLAALRDAAVDGRFHPVKPLAIRSTAIANDATVLRGPDLAALGVDADRSRRLWLGLIAAMFLASAGALVLLGADLGAWSRSAALLAALAGFFCLFAVYADKAASSPWISVTLFAATVGVFRLMALFER